MCDELVIRKPRLSDNSISDAADSVNWHCFHTERRWLAPYCLAVYEERIRLSEDGQGILIINSSSSSSSCLCSSSGGATFTGRRAKSISRPSAVHTSVYRSLSPGGCRDPFTKRINANATGVRRFPADPCNCPITRRIQRAGCWSCTSLSHPHLTGRDRRPRAKRHSTVWTSCSYRHRRWYSSCRQAACLSTNFLLSKSILTSQSNRGDFFDRSSDCPRLRFLSLADFYSVKLRALHLLIAFYSALLCSSHFHRTQLTSWDACQILRNIVGFLCDSWASLCWIMYYIPVSELLLMVQTSKP